MSSEQTSPNDPKPCNCTVHMHCPRCLGGDGVLPIAGDKMHCLDCGTVWTHERAASLAPVPAYDDLPDLMNAGRWQDATMLLIAKVDALYKAQARDPVAEAPDLSDAEKFRQHNESDHFTAIKMPAPSRVAPPSGAQKETER